MNRPIRLLVGALALVLFAPAFAQAVYTWKDDKGVTHYSDAPPPAGAKKKNVHTAPDPVASAATPEVKAANAADAAAKPTAQVTEEQQAKQRAQACKDAQTNLALLNSQASVQVDRDGDGKPDATLDADQRKQETQAMQTVVTANCG